jgi:tetratricopeptide (TPR) repeat protein
MKIPRFQMFAVSAMGLCLPFAVIAQSTQVTMKNAEKQYQDKNWERAADAFETITREDPSNSLAWLHLGSSRQKLQQYDQAVAAFKHLEKDSNFAAPALYREAASLARLNHKADAIAVLDRAVDAGFVRLQVLQQDPDLASLRDAPSFAAIVSKAEAMAHPCEHQPESRQFDFWIGEWDVVTTQGHDPAGSSSIQLILDKCVILENWTGGTTGKSFNHFDAATKKWIQDWVDSASNGVHFEGTLENGVMSFYAASLNADGTRSRRHLQFFKLDEDHVRQFSQQSTDGGQTWSVEYDLTYSRKTQ